MVEFFRILCFYFLNDIILFKFHNLNTIYFYFFYSIGTNVFSFVDKLKSSTILTHICRMNIELCAL